jgi:transcriptional regulator of heat shock response
MTAEDSILAVFQSTDGQTAGPSLQLPANITPEQLELLLNQLLQNVLIKYLEPINIKYHHGHAHHRMRNYLIPSLFKTRKY